MDRRMGWSSVAGLVLGLAALSSACETENDGYVFDGEGASGDGGADTGSGGSKGGSVSGGRGGTTNPEGGAGASATTGGSPEGGGSGGEPNPEGGTAGSVSPPVQAGDGGTATTPGTGGAAPEPTAGSGGDAGDTTPPEVTGTNPSNDASNVPGTTEIRAQFSEALDPATVTEDSFVVSVNGVDLPGALDVDDDLVTFAPGVRFPLLGNVTVTLGAEITDLAGNALSEAPYEWSFQLADGVWHAAGPVLGEGSGPQTASDQTGSVVGWTDSDQLIWAAASDDSDDGFAAPVSVTASAAPTDFQMGSIGGGAALAVWMEYPRVRSSRFTPGSGWSSPAFIDQSGAEGASGLRLATNEHGYAVAAWSHWTDGGASRSISGNRFAGGAWGTATVIDSSTTQSFTDIAVSISDNGVAGALCTRVEEQIETVWASSRSSNSWSTPATLESVERHNPDASNELTTVSQRALNVENNGRMLAVWTLYTSGIGANPPIETRFVRSTSTGTWGDFDSFGDRRGGLWLAGNGDGQALAAFSYSASAGLVPMRYTPDNGWSALTAFDGTTGANGGIYADLAIDAAGNGLMFWNPLDTPRAARYVAGSAGAQWSAPPTELSEGSAFGVSVSVSRVRGNGVAAWSDQDGIHARRFDFAD
jgi:hypothetical protein